MATLHEPQGSSRGLAPGPKPDPHPSNRGGEGGGLGGSKEVQEGLLSPGPPEKSNTKGGIPALLFLTKMDSGDSI